MNIKNAFQKYYLIAQYSPDNLTLANSHAPDNLHDCPRHNFL